MEYLEAPGHHTPFLFGTGFQAVFDSVKCNHADHSSPRNARNWPCQAHDPNRQMGISD